MRVWIDLSNSPHALFFAPISRRLEADGHTVLVTVRDNAQTVELAAERWPGARIVGGESPKGRRAKAEAIAGRVRSLRRWAQAERPDVAVSHNSYAQIVAARSLRLRAVTAMDYEHQPANHLAFRLASTVLLPDALRGATVARQGARPGKTVYYEGLKEELYLGDFAPDSGICERLGIDLAGRALVVARTAPTRAVYHRFENDLFTETLAQLSEQPDVVCVVLPRHSEQRRMLEQIGGSRLIVPDHAVDSRSLMIAADLVIGAGGTMTREAALLGVPTFTAFAGDQPTVDRWLESRGRLRRLTAPGDVLPVVRHADHATDLSSLRARSEALIDVFVDAITQRTASRAGAASPLRGPAPAGRS
jgi:predicted glycosyltransferase